MNNNNLLYIIENEDFSANINDGTFTGIDVNSPEFPYYMDNRFLKSQILMNELSEGEVPYEYLEIIASEDLISKIKNNDLSKDEMFKYIETNIEDLESHKELEESNKIKTHTIARDMLVEVISQSDMKDLDILVDLHTEEEQEIDKNNNELYRDDGIVLE
jgi:hypothetical protein